jgi:large subunit ribosomal protein L25
MIFYLTFQIFGDKEITIEVPVKIIGDSKGMAGGDLRLNNRKLKVKAQNLPDFVEADIHNMGNKLYVTVPTPDFKIMHPDNTVICQVKISRAAKSSSRSSKSSKSTCKRKEK